MFSKNVSFVIVETKDFAFIVSIPNTNGDDGDGGEKYEDMYFTYCDGGKTCRHFDDYIIISCTKSYFGNSICSRWLNFVKMTFPFHLKPTYNTRWQIGWEKIFQHTLLFVSFFFQLWCILDRVFVEIHVCNIITLIRKVLDFDKYLHVSQNL